MNFGRLDVSANLPVQFASPLGGAAWAVLAGVPVGIIALYFLKLRRRPVQVPSTLLWRRSLEDLHVNSLFQRLRQNLLLFLQLLAVLLAMLALAGPRIKGTAGQGQRFVLAIDNSASMSATDVAPTRLARAKEEAKKVVDGDGDGRPGDGHRLLRPRPGRLELHGRPRHLLRSGSTRSSRPRRRPRSATPSRSPPGLANPSKQIGEGVVATSVVTPKLLIYTDGGFPDVEGFSLGNLEPEVVVIGPPRPAARRDRRRPSARPKPAEAADATTWRSSPSRPAGTTRSPTSTRSSAGSTTTGPSPSRPRPSSSATTPTSPARRATLIDAIALKIPPQSDQSFKFDLPDTGPDRAGSPARRQGRPSRSTTAPSPLIGNPRKAQVLLVTPGQPLPGRHPPDPDGRRARRRRRRHARPGEGRPVRPRRQGRPVRPGHLRPVPPRRRPRGQRPLLRRRCPPARPTRRRKAARAAR